VVVAGCLQIIKVFNKENQFMKPQNKKCLIARNPEQRVNGKEIKRLGSTPK
jgi:hypothetical protein